MIKDGLKDWMKDGDQEIERKKKEKEWEEKNWIESYNMKKNEWEGEGVWQEVWRGRIEYGDGHREEERKHERGGSSVLGEVHLWPGEEGKWECNSILISEEEVNGDEGK